MGVAAMDVLNFEPASMGSKAALQDARLSHWFDRGRLAGYTHLFLFAQDGLRLVYPYYVQQPADEARQICNRARKESGRELLAVLLLQADLQSQLAQASDEGLFVFGDEPADAGGNVVGLSQARQLRAKQPAANKAERSALAKSLSLRELIDWKLHWLTMDVEAVINRWADVVKDLRLLASDAQAEDKLRASFERLGVIVGETLRLTQEIGIMSAGFDHSRILDEVRQLPRYVQFCATLERAQDLLVALRNKLHDQAIAKFVEPVLPRLNRGY